MAATRIFLGNEELESWDLDDVFDLGFCDDSGSPRGYVSSVDMVPSSTMSTSFVSSHAKNIVMERSRKRRMNERLYGLRSIVPNITKMDKTSIIQDAIAYIEVLQEQERRLLVEVTELEQRKDDKSPVSDIDDDQSFVHDISRKKIKRNTTTSGYPSDQPSIEQLRVCEVGERALIISYSCSIRRGSMVKLSKLFDSLNLKIMSANVAPLSGSLLHSLFVEADEMNGSELKKKIELSIAKLDATQSLWNPNQKRTN